MLVPIRSKKSSPTSLEVLCWAAKAVQKRETQWPHEMRMRWRRRVDAAIAQAMETRAVEDQHTLRLLQACGACANHSCVGCGVGGEHA
jgi:hypothetical protein